MMRGSVPEWTAEEYPVPARYGHGTPDGAGHGLGHIEHYGSGFVEGYGFGCANGGYIDGGGQCRDDENGGGYGADGD